MYKTAEGELEDEGILHASPKERDGQASQMIIDNLFSVTNTIPLPTISIDTYSKHAHQKQTIAARTLGSPKTSTDGQKHTPHLKGVTPILGSSFPAS